MNRSLPRQVYFDFSFFTLVIMIVSLAFALYGTDHCAFAACAAYDWDGVYAEAVPEDVTGGCTTDDVR